MAVCGEDITVTGNHAAGQLYCIIGPVYVTVQSQGHATSFCLILKNNSFYPITKIINFSAALLDYYAESSSNFVPTFWNKP